MMRAKRHLWNGAGSNSELDPANLFNGRPPGASDAHQLTFSSEDQSPQHSGFGEEDAFLDNDDEEDEAADENMEDEELLEENLTA